MDAVALEGKTINFGTTKIASSTSCFYRVDSKNVNISSWNDIFWVYPEWFSRPSEIHYWTQLVTIRHQDVFLRLIRGIFSLSLLRDIIVDLGFFLIVQNCGFLWKLTHFYFFSLFGEIGLRHDHFLWCLSARRSSKSYI